MLREEVRPAGRAEGRRGSLQSVGGAGHGAVGHRARRRDRLDRRGLRDRDRPAVNSGRGRRRAAIGGVVDRRPGGAVGYGHRHQRGVRPTGRAERRGRRGAASRRQEPEHGETTLCTHIHFAVRDGRYSELHPAANLISGRLTAGVELA